MFAAVKPTAATRGDSYFQELFGPQQAKALAEHLQQRDAVRDAFGEIS